MGPRKGQLWEERGLRKSGGGERTCFLLSLFSAFATLPGSSLPISIVSPRRFPV